MVKTPPKKVFWGCFGGLNPFSEGTWTLRASKQMLWENQPKQNDALTTEKAQALHPVLDPKAIPDNQEEFQEIRVSKTFLGFA